MLELQRIETIVEQLAIQAKAIDEKRGESYKPLFDKALFSCQSKLLIPCINEIKGEVTALKKEQQQGLLTVERTQFVCERIIQQIEAIKREFATLNVRQKEPRRRQREQRPLYELHKDLAQHQEWLRRLAATQQEKERQLQYCNSVQQQQRLQQEITAFDGRIERCKDALNKLEQQITYQERHQ